VRWGFWKSAVHLLDWAAVWILCHSVWVVTLVCQLVKMVWAIL
jgi:hypothetical protein